MAIQMRWLEQGEIPLGQHYVRTLWDSSHILARDEALFAWQYRPVSGDSRLGFLIAEDAGHPVGCIGRMPVYCHIHGHPVPGAAIALLVTDPAYRHGAVGVTLLKQAYEGLKLVITMGINSHVAKLYRMLGQHVVPAMPRYVCRGSTEILAAMWAACKADTPFPEERYQACPALLMPTSPVSGWRCEALTEESLEEWDDCWRQILAPVRQGTVKDAATLRWRYIEHPNFTYDAFLARDPQKKVCGLAVLRHVPLPGGVEAVRIMEFIAKDKDASRMLVRGVADRVPYNTAFVECVCLGSDWNPLRTLGLSGQGADLFSVCFNPPDFSRCGIMAAFASTVPGLSPACFVTDPSTYLTVADGDQDRPN